MINSSALLADLKAQLKALQADLKERADDPTTPWGAALQREHAEALRRERTGLTWTAWRDNEVDQAAVAWIIATTFVRFCEDNDLLVGATLDGQPVPVGWIAGPGDSTARARENQTAYFRTNTSHHDRDWLQRAFRVLAAQPAGAALVDPKHNPVWTAEISAEAAKALLDFWRRTDADGTLVHDFTDPDLGTRFLGDLYQDLSEHAKKTYALLQTPVFVEEFILDRTLTPAIKEFGIDELKLIDPTCGSGHFLLGAFERLNQQWAIEAPGMDPKQRVRKAMDSIHGVDLNPFAVAIARFRLTVAGLLAAGEKSLVGEPEMGFHLAIGDSLLGEQGGVPNQLFDDRTLSLGLEDTWDGGSDEDAGFEYGTEDLSEYFEILKTGRYHLVVGNPPYITPKDPTLNAAYRKAYATTHRQYALSVPFMELFFRLAIKGVRGGSSGYVGQITANSFMKREFGKKVIDDFIGGRNLRLFQENPVDLTVVVDTSGAYIPGHGTPTVILAGRRRQPVTSTVRAVLGVRGEPGQPREPEKGLVWTEIVKHLDDPGYDGVYVSVTDLDREALKTHPWSLNGGGASSLKRLLEASAAGGTLAERNPDIGRAVNPVEDSVLVADRPEVFRALVREVRELVDGEGLRDWSAPARQHMLLPLDAENRLRPTLSLQANLRFWPYVVPMRERLLFGRSIGDRGAPPFAPLEFYANRVHAGKNIVFAMVATHNHFALLDGSVVARHSAPVIKLPEGASEEQHLELLGVLNSSTACFWLKQVSHNKGSTVDTKGARQTLAPWEDFYEFTGTKLQEFPLPATLPLVRGRLLDGLAQQLSASCPASVVGQWLDRGGVDDLSVVLTNAADAWAGLRQRMVFEQEELDWEVYDSYGLTDEPLVYTGSFPGADPGVRGWIDLGKRAFEIVLARRVESGQEETAWFERHRSTPVVDLPAYWPEDYRAVVQRRLDLMQSDRSIGLLERPEYKRRWATVPWDKQAREALESAILDRLEQAELWRDAQGPATRSVAQLADLLRNDQVLLGLARALTGTAEPDLAVVLGNLAPAESVPYLAAYRYKPSGLEKYREWQKVWDLQRREDAGESVTIPVPPKYSTPDFQKVGYWKVRGKLDVPKERFVLYPGVGREGDTSPVLGWAGWNHRDQAVALVREIMNQQSLGASDEALVPMVAGLVELEPWLLQWHTDLEPEFGSSAADAVTGQINQLLAQLQKTRDDVNDWHPPATGRGRKRS